jgi:hypothetical protein
MHRLGIHSYTSGLHLSEMGFDQDAVDVAIRARLPVTEEIERGEVGMPVGQRLGFRWTPSRSSLPAGTSFSFYVTLPREAARMLLDRLKVRIGQGGDFLKAELSGSNPVADAATLNAIAERFVRVAAELKNQNLGDRTQLLAQQMRSQAGLLAGAETALERFRVESITRPTSRAGSGARPAAGIAVDALADPPPGFIDEDGKVRFDRLETIELGPGDQPPSFITWDAHLIAAPAQLHGPINELVLPCGRFPVAFDLGGCRLTQVHTRRARQVA